MDITNQHHVSALVSDVLFCYFSDSPEQLVVNLTSLVLQSSSANDGALFRRMSFAAQQYFQKNPLPSYTLAGSFDPVARAILEGLGRSKEVPATDEVLHLITISRKTGKTVSSVA